MERRRNTTIEMARLMVLPIFMCLLSLNLHVNAQNYLTVYCPNTTTYAPNSSYQTNLRRVLTSLASNSSSKRFASSSAGTSETIQGLYQCRGDNSLDVCKRCVSDATTKLLTACPVEKTAVVLYDECIVRFSNKTIVSTATVSPTWSMVNVREVEESEKTLFTSYLRSGLNDCATEAANAMGSKFAVKEQITFSNFSFTDAIYFMTVCTDDLPPDDCSRCLSYIVSTYLNSMNRSVGGRAITPSCYFIHETYLFYNQTGVPSLAPPPIVAPPPVVVPPQTRAPGTKSKTKVKIIAISFLAGVLLLLFCVACCFLARRRSRYNHSLVKGSGVESLQYDLATLRAATGYFSTENVLGRGGFGEVFKGTLNDGLEIAVKRLSKGSSQGAAEFKNEISVLVNLQHRNLARLLGYCLESEERILVYEFVPNKSLDYFLFDSEKQKVLNWSQRFSIIQGIAQGILYLHEESRIRIIHRDLKTSNILLDRELKPKISDFGMAKIFGVDQSHSTTARVVGTYGYMSPEYAMRGQYSEKSDVYSFGVLVLEVVTGKKNNYFDLTDVHDDLIDYVWKHWTKQMANEVIDPTLGEMYSIEEVLRCIHIGLLCVQESAMERPSMACVVAMLNNYSMTLTIPEKPAFIHSQQYTSIQWSDS